MAYIGNIPAVQYASFSKQTLTADSSTVAFTLDNAVANENEIEVFVNNVRQEPGSGKAYTASGTTLTMSAAPTTGDSFYVIFQGKATQTVTAPAGSVTTAQLADSSVSLAKLTATGTKDATTFLRGDNSFAVPAGGVNTPAFEAYLSSDQSISDAVYTKIQLNTEILDSDGNYDNSTNYRFTPTTAGKYYVYGNLTMYSDTNNTIDNFQIAIYKNGANYKAQETTIGNQETRRETINTSAIIDFNGSSDYVELFAYCDVDSGTPYVDSTLKYTNFGAFKIIE